MTRTVEAVIDRDGKIQLLEPVTPGSRRRAIVIILDEPGSSDETAILSEEALQDWNRPEEDAAWSHLPRANWSWFRFPFRSAKRINNRSPGWSEAEPWVLRCEQKTLKA